MRLDPSIATVLVALITAVGGVIVQRSLVAAKRREAELADAAAEQARRDADWRYLESSRDTAIEDSATNLARARFAENYLALCVAAMHMAGVTIPDPPPEVVPTIRTKTT